MSECLVMTCLSWNQDKRHEQMPFIQTHFLPWTVLYVSSFSGISNQHNNNPEVFPRAHIQIYSCSGDWQWMLPGKSEGKHCTEFNENVWILAVHPKDQKKIAIIRLKLPSKHPTSYELKLAPWLKTSKKLFAFVKYSDHFYLRKTQTFFIAQLKVQVS